MSNQIMSKDELSEEVAFVVKTSNPSTAVDKQAAKAVLNAAMQVIREAVADGKTVTLRGFGSFSTVRRAAKKAQNIKTRQTIDVPAYDAPVFKPSDEFKAQVSAGSQVVSNSRPL